MEILTVIVSLVIFWTLIGKELKCLHGHKFTFECLKFNNFPISPRVYLILVSANVEKIEIRKKKTLKQHNKWFSLANNKASTDYM